MFIIIFFFIQFGFFFFFFFFFLVHQQVQRGLRQGNGSKNERNLILGSEIHNMYKHSIVQESRTSPISQHVAGRPNEVYRTISKKHGFFSEMFAWKMQTKFS